MDQLQINACVVGAGIIGLPTALSILDTIPDVQVTLISESFSPNTTGDGSAGIWEPYLVAGTSTELLKQWAEQTFTRLVNIANSSDANEAGTFILGGYKLYNNKPAELQFPYWKDTVFGFHEMTNEEINMFPDHIRYGWGYTTVACESTKYLPWTLQRFQAKGGRVIKRKIQDLNELCGHYDLVVNCTGLGSRQCASDMDIKPLRGQVIRVKAPWIKMFIWMEDEGLYVLPNGETIVLGGTHDENEWDTTPDIAVRKQIWEGCLKIVPQLKDSVHVQDWSGLRPSRSPIRLERETIHRPTGITEVVHNYGHGGSGITLHWGCALDATKLCQQAIHNIRHSKQTFTDSKL